MRERLAALLLAALLLPAGALAQADAEKLRAAKALFFDRQYAQAREAWQAVRASGRGPDAQAALYWVARCSESLGESERALGEYAQYLAARPADRALAEEAKTSRVALAVKLAKAGKTQHVDGGARRARRPEPHRALLRRPAAGLARDRGGQGRGARAARDPGEGEGRGPRGAGEARPPAPRPHRALRGRPARPEAAGAREAAWVRVRIYEKGASKPGVSINLPVALADLVFKSLPDDAVADLRKEGYDARTFWERLKKTGPAEILTIEGDDGERIQVWIE